VGGENYELGITNQESGRVKNYDDKSEMAYYWLEENIGRVLLVVLFAGLGLWGLLLEGRDDLGLGQRLVRGMGPELAGIVIAAVTIDALAERRLVTERKKVLIAQIGSNRRDITELALIELRERDWLYDGSLRKAFMRGVDLSGADLFRAVLSGAYLDKANLSEARLMYANLSDASLGLSDMRKAELEKTDLSKAKLIEADLRGVISQGVILYEAYLWSANLTGAMLFEADLRSANLEKAYLSKAHLPGANLSGAKNWMIVQLEQAQDLSGAIMPDSMQLRSAANSYMGAINGPTFNEWKAQYLATHGGKETDLRDPQ
jgi:uncharacterized protein YjbI with pentapeptide repeats